MKFVLPLALYVLFSAWPTYAAPQLEYCGKVEYERKGRTYQHEFKGRLVGGARINGYVIPLNAEVVEALPDRDEGSIDVCMKGTAWEVRHNNSTSWKELLIFQVVRR